MKLVNNYTTEQFIKDFRNFMYENFTVSVEECNFIIRPVYNPHKNETAEDSVFRLVLLSNENIGNKILDYNTTLELLLSFFPHIPTMIKVGKIDDESIHQLFQIDCSTHVRKPSLVNVVSPYPPFLL